MERIILVHCAVICVIVLCLEVVVASPHYPHQKSLRSDESRSDAAPHFFWLGPRSGRKKRNPKGEEVFTSSENEREQLVRLMEAIKDTPWSVVALNGKRQTVSFTPRLGREMDDDYTNSIPGDQWLQDDDLMDEILTQRSPPFTPRLGRFAPFSPRLGRTALKNLMP